MSLSDADLERLVEETNRIRALYGPALYWGGSPKRPSVGDFVYVKSYNHNAFGYYYVIKTCEKYIFMLMQKVNENESFEFCFIPLETPMGIDDFWAVTPDKIHEFI